MASAGRSAGDEAQRARAASEVLQRKADWAGRRADDFAKGAAGEQLVAEVLAGLVDEGWVLLHDVAHPAGGNIDHLLIGPPGVVVLDAKNWSYPVRVSGSRIFTGKYNRTTSLDRLTEQVRLVQAKLPREANNAAARGYLVLAGAPDRSLALVRIGDLRIIGADELLAHLRRLERTLTAGQVDLLASELAAALPQPHALPAEAESETVIAQPNKLFDKSHRLFYLSAPWRKAGHHRLYLRDHEGTTLGWADVNSGDMDLSCSGREADFARVILGSADPSGVKLAPGDLPKVATKVLGGRILGRVGRFHMSALIGQEYRGRGRHYLYGTLVDPALTTFRLGHVDLRTGAVHPAIEGPVAKDRAPARRYLEVLQLRMPPRTPS